MGRSSSRQARPAASRRWIPADHPATHRSLATKLVRHFVADQPPPDAVRADRGRAARYRRRSRRGVARRCRARGGLAAADKAAHADGPAWSPACARWRFRPTTTPTARHPGAAWASRCGPRRRRTAGPTGRRLGRARGDDAPDRLGLQWFAGRHRQTATSMAIAETALGPLLRPETARRSRRAGSRRDAMTLLLTSPEFQRR